MWVKLMKAGSLYGCHQLACRSYFIKNYQLPVCARCTGVLIGSIAAYAIFAFWSPPLLLCLAGAAIMFTDWLIQHLKIKFSTNKRRLITGILGGYSLASIFCTIIKQLITIILN